jgi:Putative beta-lactamase-inhibitor-like, PepSY-like
MRSLTTWCAAIVVAGLIAFGISVADDKAEKIAPDKLPKAVADAIKARFPEGKITSAEKENEDGKVVYDIELTSGGLKYEMDIHEDGTIAEIEKEIKEVPAAITKAIEGKYPKAKIVEVMEVNKLKDKKETPEHYEVTIENEGKKSEVIVSLDGKSVKTEAEEKKEKEKK